MAKKFIKDLLKKSMSAGDQSSAASAYQSMAAKKAKPNTIKIDSTKKVMPIGGSKPSVMIKKQTTIKPAKPVAKNMPYKPNAVAKPKAKGVSLIKVSVGKIKK